MPWIISFLIAWILFFLLADYKHLKQNLIGGFIALFLASLVDWGGIQLGLYSFYDIVIPWFGCSAFYKWGPVFTMGVIFVQNVPQNKYKQVLNIIMASILFLAMEFLIINTHAAEYLHWSIYASLFINVLTFTCMTWITTTFIKKEKKISNNNS